MNVFVVAGESSGDQLGARLVAAMKRRVPGLEVLGVGGPALTAEGLWSLFPMTDIAVMGIGPVLARLPTILKRIRQTADAAIAARPDMVVLIDSPDFTHRVAKRIRAAAPSIPIAMYVSPTVWAWRPGRAAAMRPYTDLLLALLPFEPAVHERLGGPRTVYVGHPLMDRLDELRPAGGRKTAPLAAGRRPRIVVLPGSRRSEVSRLMPIFGDVLARVQQAAGPFDLVLPAVAHVRPMIEAAAADWSVRPEIVVGEAAKYQAFREADAALAASGTVTLELALAGLPHVIGYRIDGIGRLILKFVRRTEGISDIVPHLSAGLPNILAGRPAVPEFLNEDCTADRLAPPLAALLSDTPERAGQIAAFEEIIRRMELPAGTPAEAAAEAVLGLAR